MFKRKKKDTKICPFCAETIKSAAKICRYCHKELPDLDAPPEAPKKPGPLAGCLQPVAIGLLLLGVLVGVATNTTSSATDLAAQETAMAATQALLNDLSGNLPEIYLTPNPITGPCSNGCLFAHPENDCFIKADYDNPDAPIYYLPIDAPYESIEINIDLGERWFCSAGDAELSGFLRWNK